MGQQQLLLIVLGVIIVGIAVVVGINVFTASSLQANNNAVIADLTTIGSMAQQFYRKPLAMGGGGNTFTGAGATTPVPFKIPGSLVNTANGNYNIVTTTDELLSLQGYGTEVNDLGATLSVTMDVSPIGMENVITNVND
jgi:hypothetical protein